MITDESSLLPKTINSKEDFQTPEKGRIITFLGSSGEGRE